MVWMLLLLVLQWLLLWTSLFLPWLWRISPQLWVWKAWRVFDCQSPRSAVEHTTHTSCKQNAGIRSSLPTEELPGMEKYQQVLCFEFLSSLHYTNTYNELNITVCTNECVHVWKGMHTFKGVFFFVRMLVFVSARTVKLWSKFYIFWNTGLLIQDFPQKLSLSPI